MVGPVPDLRLFRHFVAVAEAGSFTRAAEALHLSQPALSQAVRRLEGQVGTPLIARGRSGTRGISLTHAGAVFLPARGTVSAPRTSLASRSSAASRLRS